jgi:uncharacterized protein (DUF934 family)
MPVLVKNLEIARDPWTLIESSDDCDRAANSGCIVPFDHWASHPGPASASMAGFWVDGDADIEQVRDHLEGVSLIAVRFPAFADGRGLSLGALLRSRYGFRGELRAFGDILPDLAQYLHRSGFDAFVVESRRAAEVAIASIGSISDHYQASVRQPQPAFRRICAAG